LNVWGTEARGWNGTFMILNSGTFSFSKTEFSDILINGDYGFISATIEWEKQFIIEECTFIRCCCLGNGIINTYGAPISVNIKTDTNNDKLKIINSTLEDCVGISNNVQGIYVKGSYTEKYLFESISLKYTESIENTIILLDFSDLPSTEVEIIENSEFQSKFVNMCDIVNKTSILIKNNTQNNMSLSIICNCNNLTEQTKCNNRDIFPNLECIWIENEETGYKCSEIENSCLSISRETTCLFKGAAKSINTGNILSCIWIEDEETGYKCSEIENSCLSISRETTCLFPGIVFDVTKGQTLLCMWDEESSKCISQFIENSTNTSDDGKSEPTKSNSFFIIIIVIVVVAIVLVLVIVILIIFYRKKRTNSKPVNVNVVNSIEKKPTEMDLLKINLSSSSFLGKTQKTGGF
jgi:hypothetical protein